MWKRFTSAIGFSPMVFFFLLLSGGCSSPQLGLFTKKSPHEQYADQLQKAGLQQSALGVQWNAAASAALNAPVQIELPYKETGYFAAENPSATGLIFSLKKGQFLKIAIEKEPINAFTLFVDLWNKDESGSSGYLQSADTATPGLQLEIKKTGKYLLRIQPELLSSGAYTVTITTGPSLAFPVIKSANPKIASVWGDARDAGKRRHEGVDIFAKFRTPAIAAADGYITSVRTGGLGGKVVFMRTSGKDYVLYYAHLDSQIAKEGQRVITGDTIGLIGNTGNAKTTPPHLHFGIYTNAGAVDPFPFINESNQKPADILAPANFLKAPGRTNSQTALLLTPGAKATSIRLVPKNTVLFPEAVTSSFFRVRLPDDSRGFVASKNVEQLSKPLSTISLDSSTRLFIKPHSDIAKESIHPGEKIPVYGSFENFVFTKNNGLWGWITK